mgnify:CR=1 FL=1
MATTLTRDLGLALLTNSIATGATLVVIVTLFAPVSGSHFNPLVTLVFALRRDLPLVDAAAYALAQLIGAIAGVLLAHAMFGQPLISAYDQVRSSGGQWLAEAVAAFGLVTTVMLGSRHDPDRTPALVGLYIVAAYWFTSSTSFANPAVAIARSLTGSFSGIRGVDVPAFVVAELVGGMTAAWLVGWRFNARAESGGRSLEP